MEQQQPQKQQEIIITVEISFLKIALEQATAQVENNYISGCCNSHLKLTKKLNFEDLLWCWASEIDLNKKCWCCGAAAETSSFFGKKKPNPESGRQWNGNKMLPNQVFHNKV